MCIYAVHVKVSETVQKVKVKLNSLLSVIDIRLSGVPRGADASDAKWGSYEMITYGKLRSRDHVHSGYPRRFIYLLPPRRRRCLPNAVLPAEPWGTPPVKLAKSIGGRRERVYNNSAGEGDDGDGNNLDLESIGLVSRCTLLDAMPSPHPHRPNCFTQPQWDSLIAIADGLIPSLSEEETQHVLGEHKRSAKNPQDDEVIKRFLRCRASENEAFLKLFKVVVEERLPERARGELGLFINILT